MKEKPRHRGRKLALSVAALAVLAIGGALGVAWPRLVAHYRFWQHFESLGPNAQGYLEYRHRPTGIVFVRLPGGTFSMGSSAREQELALRRLSWELSGETEFRRVEETLRYEGPVHTVTVTPFLIAKCEMREAEWRRILDADRFFLSGDEHPITHISWADCQEFCRRTELSLPTEAQWEFACRGGTEGPYPPPAGATELAWYLGNAGRKPHPVGTRAPNEYGLHDMLGSVWEWCADGFNAGFYATDQAQGVDPRCPSDAAVSGAPDAWFVLRGGGSRSRDIECRAAYRQPVSGSGYPPWYPQYTSMAPGRDDVGFRPVYWPLP